MPQLSFPEVRFHGTAKKPQAFTHCGSPGSKIDCV
jgi:hypothetical protein